MKKFLKQLQARNIQFRTSKNSFEDAQILEHLLEHTQAIVWKVDLGFNPVYIKGSLFPSGSESQSIEGELKVLLQNETYQLSQIEEETPIVLDHQWHDIQVQTTIKPFYDVQQRMSGFIGISMKSTPQSDQIELEQSDSIQTLGDFLEAASHDLRTPLSVLHTNLYLLEKTKDEIKRNQRIQMLKDTIDRLQQILDSMFLMARLDALPAYISNPIQLDSMLHNVIVNYDEMAKAKNITLEIRQLDFLPSIVGHEVELHMAVSNLVNNAIQNTTSGGFVRIHASIDENNINIKVIDNGKGISAQDLPHVFERFYRVDKYRPTEDTRVGLGLSITKRIVEKHDGQIKIESELGKGTCIVIMLPLEAHV